MLSRTPESPSGATRLQDRPTIQTQLAVNTPTGSRAVATTGLSLRLLAATPAVTRILLVDGSATSDAAIEEVCSELGADYYHDGGRISYVRAYNIGW